MFPTGSDTVQDRYACLARGAQMFFFFFPRSDVVRITQDTEGKF